MSATRKYSKKCCVKFCTYGNAYPCFVLCEVVVARPCNSASVTTCCAFPDDCWLLTLHGEGLDQEWQEFVLPYDHGEPRCSHTACLYPAAGELLIHSGSTQPFYETRPILGVNMICILISPAE